LSSGFERIFSISREYQRSISAYNFRILFRSKNVFTLYEIDAVMDGALDELIDGLATADQAEKLQNAQY
jgi:protein subunit release factor A